MMKNKKLLIGILAGVVILGIGLFLLNRYATSETEIIPTSTHKITSTSEVVITTDKTEYEQGEIIKITIRNNSDRSVWYEDYSVCWSGYPIWKLERFEKNKWMSSQEFRLSYKEGIHPSHIHFFIETERRVGDGVAKGEEVCCSFMLSGCADRSQYDAVEIKPNTKVSFDWNQKLCPMEILERAKTKELPLRSVCFMPKIMERGRYRLSFEYGLATEDVPGSDVPEFAGGTLVKDKKTIYSNEFTIK